MYCKIALDSDLPIPRSAFPTFPFEAYLDSPGRTQHDQRRLVPSALFPDKNDGPGKWSMFRILIRILFFPLARASQNVIYVIYNLFCTGQNCVVNSPVICSITLFY